MSSTMLSMKDPLTMTERYDTFGEEDWSWILPDGESIDDALAIYDNFSIEGLYPEDDADG